MCVLIYARNLAVAHRVDLIEAGFDFRPARSTTGVDPSRHEHPVSVADHLVEGYLGPSQALARDWGVAAVTEQSGQGPARTSDP